jgi:hypothetical protein
VGRKRRWAGGEGKKEREGGELLGWAERRGRERFRGFGELWFFFKNFSSLFKL